jgi:hypothetical protein
MQQLRPDQGAASFLHLYANCLIEHENFSIRVLKVFPGRMGENIICELTAYELGKHPSFTALSYVWGENSVEHRVMVNQHWVSVTRNHYAALQYLRKSNDPVLLWVDAICT